MLQYKVKKNKLKLLHSLNQQAEITTLIKINELLLESP